MPKHESHVCIETAEEARIALEQRGKNVLNAYATLNKIVQRHEATIQKRWLGKTRPARLKILLGAWPSMPLQHRPDLKALRQLQLEPDTVTPWQRMALMWPHINQEDLCKARTLLLLLNARGRNAPDVFSVEDAKPISTGCAMGCIRVPIKIESSYFARMLPPEGASEGASKGAEYGTLARTDAPTTHRDVCIPGTALLVLEVQERMLKFLVGVCRFVLHDISPAAMINDDRAYPVQPEPRLTTDASTGAFTSAAAVAAEAPYRVPQAMDLDRMVSLLAARSAAGMDHLRALREDPAYLAAALQDLADHSLKNVKPAHGAARADSAANNGDMAWNFVMRSVFSDMFIIGMYADLAEEARKLQQLHRRHVTEEAGSAEYIYAVAHMRQSLRPALGVCLEMVRGGAFGSPPLRDWFVCGMARKEQGVSVDVVPGGDTSTVHIDFDSAYESPFRNDADKSRAASVLLWTLRSMCVDSKLRKSVGLPTMLDELQRAINQENMGAVMISPRVAALLGDLSVFTQCERMASLLEPDDNEISAGVKAVAARQYEKRMAPYRRFMAALCTDPKLAIPPLRPTDSRFAYPVDEPRTKETVEVLQRAETLLDELWALVDGVLYKTAGDMKDMSVGPLLSSAAAIRRTRSWAEPSVALTAATAAMAGVHANGNGGGKKKKGAKKAAANAASASAVDASAAAGTADAATEMRPFSALFYRLYTEKTDGASDGSDGSNILAASTAKNASIKVDARALKALRAVFLNPDGGGAAGEVAWTDFVHGMTSAGFHAEKMYGSLWHFRPAKAHVAGVAAGADGSMQIHEPYAQSKLSSAEARRIGHRLARAYGWTRDTFAAKGK